MISSRRKFLASIGAATAARLAAQNQPQQDPIGNDDGATRLDRNENAYGPSQKVADAIKRSLHGVDRYPTVEPDSLAERIASVHQVKKEQVLLGCGSTEILRMAASAYLGREKQLLQALPTFGAMEDYARAASAEVISVPLDSRYSHDLAGMLARVTPSTGLVYVCNPNNPTGSLTPRPDLELFLEKLPASTFVLIDEAYHHYAGKSAMYSSFIDHPTDDPRLIVTRTFSIVYGLAGMRVGYAIGSPDSIRRLRQFATPQAVSTPAAEAAAAALDDIDSLNEFVSRNANDRQEFFNQALARAVKPIDSHSNFVMLNTFHPSEEVLRHFRQNNVLIAGGFPSMDTHIRISLGRPEEMQRFWHAWDMLPYPKHTMQH